MLVPIVHPVFTKMGICLKIQSTLRNATHKCIIYYVFDPNYALTTRIIEGHYEKCRFPSDFNEFCSIFLMIKKEKNPVIKICLSLLHFMLQKRLQKFLSFVKGKKKQKTFIKTFFMLNRHF